MTSLTGLITRVVALLAIAMMMLAGTAAAQECVDTATASGDTRTACPTSDVDPDGSPEAGGGGGDAVPAARIDAGAGGAASDWRVSAAALALAALATSALVVRRVRAHR